MARRATGRLGTLAGFVLLFAVGGRSSAQEPPGGSPDSGVVQTLEDLRERFHLPALAAVSVAGDSIVDLAAVGRRVADSTTTVLPTDQWDIGSLTKGMTGTSASG